MVYIVGYKRTPFGCFNGALSNVNVCELASVPIKAVLAQMKPPQVDMLAVGHALPAGCGQSPSTLVLSHSGLPLTIPSFSVNKVCASGMRAITVAADAIRLGDASIALAGGMESMSLAPHLLPSLRKGVKFGAGTGIIDSLEYDGLRDCLRSVSMGVCGEKLAESLNVSRKDQDELAKQSFSRAIQSEKQLQEEIVPVAGLEKDEQLLKYNPDKMATLKPAFKADGTITAANSSPMNDGAAFMLLADDKAVKENGWSPIARIVAHADAAVSDTRDFPLAIVPAVQKALRKAGIDVQQVGLFEFNEAFASVPEAVCRALGITNDANKVNAKGGAVAIGHPLGASGARITGTLALSLYHSNDVRYGVAAVCNGGGGATAIVLERVQK